MKNFWYLLPRPFFVLAPMEDVTDTVFRQMVARCARPDVYFTEFTSCDALVSKGRQKVLHRLQFCEKERPIVAQIWGNSPDYCYQAAVQLRDMGFDGIDINMGCPDRTIVKHGFCGGLIRQPQLAQALIRSAQKGANGIPVSVKTRIGYDRVQTQEWLHCLLECKPAAITLHARTVKEMSKVPAHWEEIGSAVEIRNQFGADTLIIGNGDVRDRADGMEKYRLYHPDGIMIGRGIFTDIFAFARQDKSLSHTPQEMLQLLREHITLFEKTWGDTKIYSLMKKFFKIYVHGVSGAHDLRIKLMATKNVHEALRLLDAESI